MSDYLLHFIISLAMVAASALVLGTFAIVRRTSKLSVVFAWYCYAIAVWSFFQIFMIVPGDTGRAYFFARLSQIGVVFIPTLFLHFVYEFTSVKLGIHRKILFVGYLISVVAFLSIPTPYFISGVVPKFGGIINFVLPGPADYVFVAYFIFASVYGVIRLARSYWRAVEAQKPLAKLVFLGSMIAYAGGGSNFFLTFGLDPYPLTPFGTYGVVLYFSFMAYAVFRYEFIDVKSAIKLAHREKLAALGVLAASINHEIKNPLYVIRGLAETELEKIEASCTPQSNLEAGRLIGILRKMIAQTERAHFIAKRLSEFARPDAEPQCDEFVNLAQALDDAVFFVGHEFRDRKLNLVKKIPQHLPQIKGNKGQIEEVFLNLILNAFQAMKEGGTLTIASGQKESALWMSFEDTGPGIKKEVLNQIFKPFFTTKGASGTGLGLYITKQLIERNGGRISVHSQEGKGTVFTLEFPSKPVS